ncbi:MAG TPA: hypothetical protein VGN64_08030 [Dyadobacter sp.]|jgi:hypothetical protein|nr:hypothetical protein [Dyadobacter sp.]
MDKKNNFFSTLFNDAARAGGRAENVDHEANDTEEQNYTPEEFPLEVNAGEMNEKRKPANVQPPKTTDPYSTFFNANYDQLGYEKGKGKTASDGECKRDLESYEADFKVLIQEKAEDSEKKVCEVSIALSGTGSYDEEKAKLTILKTYHETQHAKWLAQFNMPGTDPNSLFYPVYKKYDAGYKRGLTTRNYFVTFGRENGLANIFLN